MIPNDNNELITRKDILPFYIEDGTDNRTYYSLQEAVCHKYGQITNKPNYQIDITCNGINTKDKESGTIMLADPRKIY